MAQNMGDRRPLKDITVNLNDCFDKEHHRLDLEKVTQ